MCLSAAVLFALSLTSASAAPASPPEELADRVADQLRQLGRAPHVTVEASPDLTGVAAVDQIAQRLAEAFPSKGTPDLEVTLTLSRLRGRVVLAGEAPGASGGPSRWLIASAEETPEWWPWLALGETHWHLCGGYPGVVRDAEAGDLAGDGGLEFVAATDEEILVFVPDGDTARLVSRAPIDDSVGPSNVASRDPRTLLRIVPQQGGTAEVRLRRSEEQHVRIFGWKNGTLVRLRNSDQPLVAARGKEWIGGGLIPGENLFADPPRLERADGERTPRDSKPWVDLRAAPLMRPGSTSALAWAWLDRDALLHLLTADLSEKGRVEHCGTAFAVGEWGSARALCSGDGPENGTDRLTLYDAAGRSLWQTTVDGTVQAVAAGTVNDRAHVSAGGYATALVFVRPADERERTVVYRLRSLP